MTRDPQPPQSGATRPVAGAARTGGSGTDGSAASTGWRGAGREITIAVLLVFAVTAAAWALYGPAAAGFTAVGCAALSLVALRTLIEPHEPPPAPAPNRSQEIRASVTFFGFWRTRSDLTDATRSLSAWDYALRPRLTNLLAARLAERHGISLSEDPEAASRVLTGGKQGRPDLWAWIDPQRQTPPDAGSRPGIPANILAALIDRLERL